MAERPIDWIDPISGEQRTFFPSNPAVTPSPTPKTSTINTGGIKTEVLYSHHIPGATHVTSGPQPFSGVVDLESTILTTLVSIEQQKARLGSGFVVLKPSGAPKSLGEIEKSLEEVEATLIDMIAHDESQKAAVREAVRKKSAASVAAGMVMMPTFTGAGFGEPAPWGVPHAPPGLQKIAQLVKEQTAENKLTDDDAIPEEEFWALVKELALSQIRADRLDTPESHTAYIHERIDSVLKS
jgi:hypothetical protein